MLCPNCSTSFALTWARYFKSFTRKHSCPTCGAVGRVRFGWRNWALLGFLALVPGPVAGFSVARLFMRLPFPSRGELLLALVLPCVLSLLFFFVLDWKAQDRARLVPDEGPAELRRTLRELTLGVGLGLVGVFLCIFVFGQSVSRWSDATQAWEARFETRAAREAERDTYAGYVKACEQTEQDLTAPGADRARAHRTLALAYAMRWGEHGDAAVATLARQHVAEARQLGAWNLASVEAFVQLFGGDPLGAERVLQQVAGSDVQCAGGPTVRAALGALQLRGGELDRARENLLAAQTRLSSSPRVNANLGEVFRLQGDRKNASHFFEAALRYEPEHAGALLGLTLLAIDGGDWPEARKRLAALQALTPPVSPRVADAARLAAALVRERAGGAEAQAESKPPDGTSAVLALLQARRLLFAGDRAGAEALVREAQVPVWERGAMEREYALLTAAR